MAPAGPVQAARMEQIARDQPLSARARYLMAQAEAIHRIYAPIHPTRRLHIVLSALDQPQGNPGAVRVEPGLPLPEMIDAAYLGTLTYAPLEPEAEPTPGSGLQSDQADLTIIAPVPRQIRPDDLTADKTAPDFAHHPVLGPLLWRAPVLFEEGKYLYERRQESRCIDRHTFAPIARATRQPLGALPVRADKPPAILIGFHWLKTGGAEKLAFDCVTWARKAGFRVLVVAELADIHRHANKLPDDPEVEFIRADAYLHPDKWFPFLENLIRTENVRALHIHHNVRLYDTLMRLKAVFPDLVVIDSTHIIEYADGGFPRTSGVWTNYIDHHHVISRDLVAFYLDRFGVSEKVVLGRMLAPAVPEAPDPQFRLSAGQKSCRIAFVGRMVHQKRAPLVVEIARKLQEWCKSKGIELHVDMIGTGAYFDVVRHMIARAKLANTVTLHAPDADVPGILAQADLLLLPSANEGLALVCYEAIGQGALPISTDVGAQDELMPEALLLPRAPRACVKAAVALIQRLMTEAGFLQECKTETLSRYRALRADPTAEEILTALYADILERAPAS